MLRLYLKALCEIPDGSQRVSFVSLNDRIIDTASLRRYSDGNLAQWKACGRSKVSFSKAALEWGLRSDRIICGHVAQLPLAWAVSILKPHIPYFLVAHGIEVWRPFTFFELRALHGARCVWCVSDYTRRQVMKYSGITEDRTAVLPNALDPYLEPPQPVPDPNGPPIILTISRLTTTDSYKGIDHLISAMPAVRSQVPGARLRIVGRGDSLPSLQALSRRLNVSDAVDFPGFRTDSELREEFAACRLFALPSRKEGFGLVYLEAMAHGRPCLGARSGGVPEVISNGTGELVEYGDVPGIAAAIIAAVRREWRKEELFERAQVFSFPRFKERLAALVAMQELSPNGLPRQRPTPPATAP
jgi:phosphatidylinositol alpha-1,6-mannosyltransferase